MRKEITAVLMAVVLAAGFVNGAFSQEAMLTAKAVEVKAEESERLLGTEELAVAVMMADRTVKKTVNGNTVYSIEGFGVRYPMAAGHPVKEGDEGKAVTVLCEIEPLRFSYTDSGTMGKSRGDVLEFSFKRIQGNLVQVLTFRETVLEDGSVNHEQVVPGLVLNNDHKSRKEALSQQQAYRKLAFIVLFVEQDELRRIHRQEQDAKAYKGIEEAVEKVKELRKKRDDGAQGGMLERAQGVLREMEKAEAESKAEKQAKQ